jgi:CRISPR/Cas system-associated protein Cas10 (large subunit of type III CRISPR-Cas system)
MAPVLGKYKTLTVTEKMSLLQDVDKKSESKGKLALSLSSILKKHLTIEESIYKFLVSVHSPQNTKNLKEKLYEFFSQIYAVNVPVALCGTVVRIIKTKK